MKQFAGLLLSLVLAFGIACTSSPHPSAVADIVLTNAKIVTVDDDNPSATAIAIKGEIIAAVGSLANIDPLIGAETKV